MNQSSDAAAKPERPVSPSDGGVANRAPPVTPTDETPQIAAKKPAETDKPHPAPDHPHQPPKHAGSPTPTSEEAANRGG